MKVLALKYYLAQRELGSEGGGLVGLAEHKVLGYRHLNPTEKVTIRVCKLHIIYVSISEIHESPPYSFKLFFYIPGVH